MKCECKIIFDEQNPSIMRIEYCPLHEAAKDMLEFISTINILTKDDQIRISSKALIVRCLTKPPK